MPSLQLSRRSLLSFLGLAATATVARGRTAEAGLIEEVERVSSCHGTTDDYSWNSHTHTFTLSADDTDYIIAQLTDPMSASRSFPVGTVMMFEGKIAPHGWTIVS